MIEQIGTNRQPIVESGSSTSQPNSRGGIRDNDVDVSIQVNYAFLVDKAMQPPQVDNQRVQQAKDLLQSGGLDSEQIIREAIENILKYGV